MKELGRWRELEPGQTGCFYLEKRLKFIDPVAGAATKNGAPFDTMIVVWR